MIFFPINGRTQISYFRSFLEASELTEVCCSGNIETDKKRI